LSASRTVVITGLCVLFSLACERPIGGDARQARARLERTVALYRGTEFVSLLGEKRRLPIPRTGVVSIAPDLKTHIGFSSDQVNLYYSSGSRRIEFFNVAPRDGVGRRFVVDWLSETGDVFVLYDKYERRATVYCAITRGSIEQTLTIADIDSVIGTKRGMVAFRSGELVLIASDGTATTLARMPFLDSRSLLAAHDEAVLACQTADDPRSVRKHPCMLIPLSGGQTQEVAIPMTGILQHVIPVSDDEYVMTVIDGDENLDGSPLEKLFLWNIRTSRTVLLYRGYKGHNVLRLPKTFPPRFEPCPQRR